MAKQWGYILVGSSLVLFLLIVLLPFLEMPTRTKTALLLGLAVAGEICFWVGGILLGKELFAKFKRKLNPLNWRRGKRGAQAPEKETGE